MYIAPALSRVGLYTYAYCCLGMQEISAVETTPRPLSGAFVSPWQDET